MKLENYDTAVAIVEQIKKYQATLASLNEDQVTVIINAIVESGRIMTIGAQPSYEHPHTPLALKFIDGIKTDLRTRIEDLKNELGEL